MSDHYPIELLIRCSGDGLGRSYQTSPSRETTASDDRSLRHITSTHETPSGVRVGAFNVRVFGKSKVAKKDVLKILVQVVL